MGAQIFCTQQFDEIARGQGLTRYERVTVERLKLFEHASIYDPCNGLPNVVDLTEITLHDAIELVGRINRVTGFLNWNLEKQTNKQTT